MVSRKSILTVNQIKTILTERSVLTEKALNEYSAEKSVCISLSFHGGDFYFERISMNRIALIGIMVEDNSAALKINGILHDYGKYIIGRMGIPHAKENLSVISVVLDAPADIISTVSGKLGQRNGVSTKTIYSKSGCA